QPLARGCRPAAARHARPDRGGRWQAPAGVVRPRPRGPRAVAARPARDAAGRRRVSGYQRGSGSAAQPVRPVRAEAVAPPSSIAVDETEHSYVRLRIARPWATL